MTENGTYMTLKYQTSGLDPKNDKFSFLKPEDIVHYSILGTRDALIDNMKAGAAFATIDKDNEASCSAAWGGTAGW